MATSAGDSFMEWEDGVAGGDDPFQVLNLSLETVPGDEWQHFQDFLQEYNEIHARYVQWLTPRLKAAFNNPTAPKTYQRFKRWSRSEYSAADKQSQSYKVGRRAVRQAQVGFLSEFTRCITSYLANVLVGSEAITSGLGSGDEAAVDRTKTPVGKVTSLCFDTLIDFIAKEDRHTTATFEFFGAELPYLVRAFMRIQQTCADAGYRARMTATKDILKDLLNAAKEEGRQCVFPAHIIADYYARIIIETGKLGTARQRLLALLNVVRHAKTNLEVAWVVCLSDHAPAHILELFETDFTDPQNEPFALLKRFASFFKPQDWPQAFSRLSQYAAGLPVRATVRRRAMSVATTDTGTTDVGGAEPVPCGPLLQALRDWNQHAYQGPVWCSSIDWVSEDMSAFSAASSGAGAGAGAGAGDLPATTSSAEVVTLFDKSQARVPGGPLLPASFDPTAQARFLTGREQRLHERHTRAASRRTASTHGRSALRWLADESIDTSNINSFSEDESLQLHGFDFVKYYHLIKAQHFTGHLSQVVWQLAYSHVYMQAVSAFFDKFSNADFEAAFAKYRNLYMGAHSNIEAQARQAFLLDLLEGSVANHLWFVGIAGGDLDSFWQGFSKYCIDTLQGQDEAAAGVVAAIGQHFKVFTRAQIPAIQVVVSGGSLDVSDTAGVVLQLQSQSRTDTSARLSDVYEFRANGILRLAVKEAAVTSDLASLVWSPTMDQLNDSPEGSAIVAIVNTSVYPDSVNWQLDGWFEQRFNVLCSQLKEQGAKNKLLLDLLALEGFTSSDWGQHIVRLIARTIIKRLAGEAEAKQTRNCCGCTTNQVDSITAEGLPAVVAKALLARLRNHSDYEPKWYDAWVRWLSIILAAGVGVVGQVIFQVVKQKDPGGKFMQDNGVNLVITSLVFLGFFSAAATLPSVRYNKVSLACLAAIALGVGISVIDNVTDDGKPAKAVKGMAGYAVFMTGLLVNIAMFSIHVMWQKRFASRVNEHIVDGRKQWPGIHLDRYDALNTGLVLLVFAWYLWLSDTVGFNVEDFLDTFPFDFFTSLVGAFTVGNIWAHTRAYKFTQDVAVPPDWDGNDVLDGQVGSSAGGFAAAAGGPRVYSPVPGTPSRGSASGSGAKGTPGAGGFLGRRRRSSYGGSGGQPKILSFDMESPRRPTMGTRSS